MRRVLYPTHFNTPIHRTTPDAYTSPLTHGHPLITAHSSLGLCTFNMKVKCSHFCWISLRFLRYAWHLILSISTHHILVHQSHTGASLAKAFQNMLARFNLTDKVLSVTADNATSNDKQVTALAAMDNSFDEENHVRCFNHTVQLSAKALIKLFNVGMSSKKSAEDGDDDLEVESDMPGLEDIEEEVQEEDEAGADEAEEGEDAEDDIDELAELSASERDKVMSETATVREAVSKVSTRNLLQPFMSDV